VNTVTDLRAELRTLAEYAPSDAEIRSTLAGLRSARSKRRRTTALIGVAAAVILVAGGAGITGAVLSQRSAGPAAPSPVVSVPDVPLPADTKLIRHHLQPVVSPVTAIPPDGLTGRMWLSSPGRLAVSFFDPTTASDGWTSYTPGKPSASPRLAAAGYLVTEDRHPVLNMAGPTPKQTVTASGTPVTVGGHAATLETAPEGATDAFGLPAAQRISWRLSDGRWIYIWASGPSGDPVDTATLKDFAASIREVPTTLNRTLGIGLTLPGLTLDSSMNSWPAITYTGATVFLCPAGVDPMATTYSTSSGSGSIGPAGTTTTYTGDDPATTCVTATAINVPAQQRESLGATQAVRVKDTVAHVDVDKSVAWVDLGNGVTGIVGAPPSAHLSAADLAALAASVRLSPAVTVLPLPSPQVHVTAETAVETAVSSSAATAPPPASRPTGTDAAESDRAEAARSSAASAASSAATAAARALQLTVLGGYLDAVKSGDCDAAAQFFIGKPYNGDLCHMPGLRLLDYRIDGGPATPSPDEADFAVTITITGGGETMPDGDLTWFFDLHRQPGGDWRITGAGSGP
jgi:hypothetical protein